jgi:hypothetical protein
MLSVLWNVPYNLLRQYVILWFLSDGLDAFPLWRIENQMDLIRATMKYTGISCHNNGQEQLVQIELKEQVPPGRQIVILRHETRLYGIWEYY